MFSEMSSAKQQRDFLKDGLVRFCFYCGKRINYFGNKFWYCSKACEEKQRFEGCRFAQLKYAHSVLLRREGK